MYKMWNFYDQTCDQEDFQQTTDDDTRQTIHDYTGSLVFMLNEPKSLAWTRKLKTTHNTDKIHNSNNTAIDFEEGYVQSKYGYPD